MESIDNAVALTTAPLGAGVRRTSAIRPTVLLIGASTGGPQALTALLAGLVANGVSVPICVTLHMPPEFMPVIAAHVTRTCGIEACVVTEMREVAAGRVHFSPGDRHLNVRRGRLATELHLRASPTQEHCKPAIDAMFTTAAKSLGPSALAVVLSGMGKDGLVGARAIVAAGGSVLVQDKASSAVWGMPGAVVEAELAAAVLSPPALAVEIAHRLRRGGRR